MINDLKKDSEQRMQKSWSLWNRVLLKSVLAVPIRLS